MKQTQHDVQGTQSGHVAPETQNETAEYTVPNVIQLLKKCIYLLLNNPKTL